MTTAPDATDGPPVPDAVRPQWEELNDLAPRMIAAHEEYERLRLECRERVIALLGAGVQLRYLIDRPFSRSLLGRIRQRGNLPNERRRRKAS